MLLRAVVQYLCAAHKQATGKSQNAPDSPTRHGWTPTLYVPAKPQWPLGVMQSNTPAQNTKPRRRHTHSGLERDRESLPRFVSRDPRVHVCQCLQSLQRLRIRFGDVVKLRPGQEVQAYFGRTPLLMRPRTFVQQPVTRRVGNHLPLLQRPPAGCCAREAQRCSHCGGAVLLRLHLD